MHLTRQILDLWAERQREIGRAGVFFVRLRRDESMAHHARGTVHGPAFVELVVFRDGGWSARSLSYETTGSIGLAVATAPEPEEKP